MKTEKNNKTKFNIIKNMIKVTRCGDKKDENDINYIDPTSRKRGAPQSQIRKQLAKLNLQQYSTKYDLQNIIFAKGPQQKKPTPGRLGDFASFTVNDAIKEGGLIDRGILRANSFTMAGLYPNFFYMFSNESK